MVARAILQSAKDENIYHLARVRTPGIRYETVTTTCVENELPYAASPPAPFRHHPPADGPGSHSGRLRPGRLCSSSPLSPSSVLLITGCNSEMPTTPSLSSRNFLEWLTELRETRYFLDHQVVIRDVSREQPGRGDVQGMWDFRVLSRVPLPQHPDVSTNLEAFLNPPSEFLQGLHYLGMMGEISGPGRLNSRPSPLPGGPRWNGESQHSNCVVGGTENHAPFSDAFQMSPHSRNKGHLTVLST